MKYPTRFQQRTIWSAAAGFSMLVLGSLLVGLVWLVGQIFGFLQPVLIPLIVAGIIAYLLDPVVRLIEKRGLSRLWSVIGVFIAGLVLMTLLVAAVLPAIRREKIFTTNLQPAIRCRVGCCGASSGSCRRSGGGRWDGSRTESGPRACAFLAQAPQRAS